jgi:gamma-glutamylcyclotransferase (GGCT)/AIG2-like uncharacterized protein YtfP
MTQLGRQDGKGTSAGMANATDRRIFVCHCGAPRTAYHLRVVASDRLFVYGSLKRGARHHDELRGARFLGEACTAPGYELEPVGEYLALVQVPDATGSVNGELFEVDAGILSQLDEFEGDGYDRGFVRLLEKGEETAEKAENRRDAAVPRDAARPSFALAYLKKTR